jgi:broad specificity phosphatase PhoE
MPLMTEQENRNKYPEGTQSWRKDPVEYYRCEKHDRPTFYNRMSDIVAHFDDTECY